MSILVICQGGGKDKIGMVRSLRGQCLRGKPVVTLTNGGGAS